MSAEISSAWRTISLADKSECVTKARAAASKPITLLAECGRLNVLLRCGGFHHGPSALRSTQDRVHDCNRTACQKTIYPVTCKGSPYMNCQLLSHCKECSPIMLPSVSSTRAMKPYWPIENLSLKILPPLSDARLASTAQSEQVK